LVDGKLTNENDKKAMGMMLRRSKSILGSNDFTALFDKCYHTGSEFKIAHDLGVDTLVAIPKIGRASQAPDPSYNAEYFDYDANSDSYTCPQGHTLTSNGSWYTAKQNGKIIQRSEFTPYIEGASVDFGLILTAYNLKRIINILKVQGKGLLEGYWGFLERFWAVISLTNRVLNPLGRFWMQ
jgi:hypothetical protein